MSAADRRSMTGEEPGGVVAMIARSSDLVRRGLHLVDGQKPRHELAAELVRRAKAGEVAAQRKLGLAYASGEGVPRDDREAAFWFRRSADQGDADAQANLGWAYALGLGVVKNDAEALAWWRKAAEQGHADNQMELAWVYTYGFCVPEDAREAARWYRRAAEQGHPEAQSYLGWCYATGRGLPKDRIEAHKWITLAVLRARRWDAVLGAESQKALVATMSAEEIEEARERVKHWVDTFGRTGV